jgi:hypothetical protein
MFPPGHVALGIHLVRRLPHLASGHAATAALLIGTLTPDLLDKTLQWTGVYPWGRTWGHSLIGNLVLAVIAMTLWTVTHLSAREKVSLFRSFASGRWPIQWSAITVYRRKSGGASVDGQGVAHQPAAVSDITPVDPLADFDSAPTMDHPSSPSESDPVAGSGTPAPETAPGSTGTTTLRTTAALLTCLCIGQWSHIFADVWNDLEQGAVSTGYLWSAWMAWPWMTPDDLPCTMSPWLPGRRWITFSEALVVILALRLGLGPRAKSFRVTTRAPATTRDETGG